MSSARSLARLTVLSFALACVRSHSHAAGAAPAAAYAADDELASQPVVLEFENNNWADVVLYVQHDGRWSRLQLVAAAHTGEITVPAHLLGQGGIFRVAVRRVGGNDSFVSEPISTRTGHTVRLTIESDLQRSSVGVW